MTNHNTKEMSSLLDEIQTQFMTIPREDFVDYINECVAEYGQKTVDRALVWLEEQNYGIGCEVSDNGEG